MHQKLSPKIVSTIVNNINGKGLELLEGVRCPVQNLLDHGQFSSGEAREPDRDEEEYLPLPQFLNLLEDLP